MSHLHPQYRYSPDQNPLLDINQLTYLLTTLPLDPLTGRAIQRERLSTDVLAKHAELRPLVDMYSLHMFIKQSARRMCTDAEWPQIWANMLEEEKGKPWTMPPAYWGPNLTGLPGGIELLGDGMQERMDMGMGIGIGWTGVGTGVERKQESVQELWRRAEEARVRMEREQELESLVRHKEELERLQRQKAEMERRAVEQQQQRQQQQESALACWQMKVMREKIEKERLQEDRMAKQRVQEDRLAKEKLQEGRLAKEKMSRIREMEKTDDSDGSDKSDITVILSPEPRKAPPKKMSIKEPAESAEERDVRMWRERIGREMEELAQLEREQEKQRLAELERQKQIKRELEGAREKEELLEVERQKQRQKEHERMAELQRLKQKQLETDRDNERLLEMERQRREHIERQKESERIAQLERQKEVDKQKENERLAELERQKQKQLETERENEKLLALEHQRQKQLETERENERLLELERQKQQLQRERDKENEQLLELERLKQKQLEMKRENEKLLELALENQRQRALLMEMARQKEAGATQGYAPHSDQFFKDLSRDLGLGVSTPDLNMNFAGPGSASKKKFVQVEQLNDYGDDEDISMPSPIRVRHPESSPGQDQHRAQMEMERYPQTQRVFSPQSNAHVQPQYQPRTQFSPRPRYEPEAQFQSQPRYQPGAQFAPKAQSPLYREYQSGEQSRLYHQPAPAPPPPLPESYHHSSAQSSPQYHTRPYQPHQLQSQSPTQTSFGPYLNHYSPPPQQPTSRPPIIPIRSEDHISHHTVSKDEWVRQQVQHLQEHGEIQVRPKPSSTLKSSPKLRSSPTLEALRSSQRNDFMARSKTPMSNCQRSMYPSPGKGMMDYGGSASNGTATGYSGGATAHGSSWSEYSDEGSQGKKKNWLKTIGLFKGQEARGG